MPRRACAAVAVFAVFVVSALAAVAAQPVGADPIRDKQAEAAAIQRRLDTMNASVEALDEQFNQATLRMQAATAAVGAAQARLAASGQRLAVARASLSTQAVDAYVHGSPNAAGANAVGATGAADPSIRRAYAAELVSRSASAVDDLRAAEQDAADARSQTVAAQSAQRGAVQQVSTVRAQVQQAVDSEQAALSNVNGEVATLIAEQKAKAEAEARAKAAAELAARQAAEAHRLALLAAARSAPPPPTVVVKPISAPLPSFSSAPAAPAAPTAPTAVATPTAPAAPRKAAPAAAGGAGAAIAEARRQLGKPYQWAGAGPGSFDCSGLTAWAWRAAGVSLDHSTYAQWDETTHVSLTDMQPGDLIFYGSDLHHVAMYTGGGMMIEAPHTGANVQEVAVRYGGVAGIGRVSG